jgi:hypothetical protein|tara:strand:+ start:60 stop:590 length:531 start_codon:yes stop_codon:yes gene_type:complete
MAKQYNVQEEILEGILEKLFDRHAIRQQKNIFSIKDIIHRELSESALESITHLMLTEKTFIPTKIGDYVRMIPPDYHVGREFEIDVLEDMGLLGKGDKYSEYYVYARVIDDTSWGSDPYDPFYKSIKVNLMYHDEHKTLKHVEAQISPLHALYIQKRFIPFLKEGSQTELKLEDNG